MIHVSGNHSSLLGEFLAIHEGLKLVLKGPWLTTNKEIHVYSDSKTTISILNAQFSDKTSQLDIRLLRRLSDIFEWAVDMNWRLVFRHIDGVSNSFADFLSRKQIT